ncbi:hypothetical protein [Acinetobacter tjernbergiae]|uniref:Uncharacterized protein n=1 Tax=Acinetobacter tjernbergiae DSM 14971 = CIP 107465 TaxID=1120928 RepID=V2URZ1_9GAMM|nr:hypothetical protein [Acinetobacter tjernbergiae]ESK57493.1 hypothetical protein F990_00029 [Acinetobacter tjernbergiae DSM 14971 = CIP 107465]
MERNPIIFLNIDNEDKLYSFNFESRELDQSNISKNQRASNGYGLYAEVDKQRKLVAIFGCGDFIYFLFDRALYRLDDESLTVSQKDGFLKNTFQLFINGQKKIDIRYKQIWDIDNDVFLDVKDWLDIKPREKLLFKLSKYAEFLKEENLERRCDVSWHKELGI